MANEDDRVEIPVTIKIRGPVFLAKMLEEGMAWELWQHVEDGIKEALNRFGDTTEEIAVWDATVHFEQERKLTPEERQKEQR